MVEIKKILIISPAWVGDIVMSQALFKFLKQKYASVQIDVLAPSWSHTLLRRMPEVTQIFNSPFKHGYLMLKKRWQLGQVMRDQHYDQVIVLSMTWKSAITPFAAKIPQRTGWLGEMRFGLLNDTHYLDKKKFPLMVDRFLALGNGFQKESSGWRPYRPHLPVSSETRQTILARFSLSPESKPVLALCPGAQYGPSKRWPEKYFAVVANHKFNEGWQIWLLGGEKEQPLAKTIQHLTQQRCIDLTGKTTLDEVIDLLALAHTVISNDSGLMHIAAALDKPLIAIYGSSSLQHTPPLSDHAKIISINLACSPCFKRICPLKHFKCLIDLKPDLVLQAMSQTI